ncbi:hypothetical protein [Microbacterium maritypicum]|uniref:hypothetical protein n=1 Tax=Microbacterium maritypicum TaxID=33918 RepID=UPI003D72DA6A
MSEYTPTTEEMRAFYTAERLDGPHLGGFPPPTVEQAESEFNAWLAAHDAEVRDRMAEHAAERTNELSTRLAAATRELAEARAQVVAEEPEWEYGVSYSTPTGPSIDGYRVRSYMKARSVEKAQEFAALVDRPMIQKRTKAVPAGEWVSVPVEQEGAET